MLTRPERGAAVLSERALNRALLARQLLLDRERLPIPDALEALGGIQNQSARSGYVALWSRLAGFARDELTEALGARTVAQGTSIRATIHLLSADDFRLFAAGSRDARRAWWARTNGRAVDGATMERAATRVRALLADGPRRRRELVDSLAGDGAPPLVWEGIAQRLDLVRVPPSGTWSRPRADVYALADAWLGPDRPDAGAGLDRLIRAYLGGFGPAPVVDIATWAGLPATVVRTALDGIETVSLRDAAGRDLVDLPGRPLPHPDTPAPVRFLPPFDATLLAHARRTGILPERFRRLVFNTRTPQSAGTFLVDGAVAGTWRQRDGRIVTEPFEPLRRADRHAVAVEAEALALFHAG